MLFPNYNVFVERDAPFVKNRALIDGEVVPYDECCAVTEELPQNGMVYIGMGMIFSVKGVRQFYDREPEQYKFFVHLEN